MGTILPVLRESNNLNVDYVASRLHLSVEEYTMLETGEKRMTVDIAKSLSNIYKIVPEYFFESQAMVNHHNIGIGSNSNSGYIQTYQNYPPEILKEMFKTKKED